MSNVGKNLIHRQVNDGVLKLIFTTHLIKKSLTMFPGTPVTNDEPISLGNVVGAADCGIDFDDDSAGGTSNVIF